MKKVRLFLTALAVSVAAIGTTACTSATAPDDCPPDVDPDECWITHGPNGITHGPNG